MSQPRGDKWIARWRSPEGASRSKSFPTKLAADRYERQMKTDIDAGRYIDPSAGRITLAEYLQDWLEGRHNIAPATRHNYQGSITGQINPTLGNRPINKITPADIRTFIRVLVDNNISAARIRTIMAPLRQAFEQAVEDQLILRNPCKNVQLPRDPGHEMLILTAEEVARLDQAAGGQDGLVITFLAYTGMRWGEMAALNVGDVDVLRGEVRVWRSFAEHHGMGPTKTRQSRTIPLEDRLAERMRAHVTGRAATEPLFPAPRGGRLLANGWRKKVWTAAKQGAAIDPAVRIHDLRHTAATWLVQLTDIKTAMEWLGHSNIATTAQYIHTSSDRLRQAAAKLGGLRDAEAEPSASIATVTSLPLGEIGGT